MKKLIPFLLMVTTSIFANLVNINSYDIYIGKEYYNHAPTGNTCTLQIVEAFSAHTKGLNCTAIDLKFHFSHNAKNHIKENVRLYSRITNYHTPEYPSIKTCAVSTIEENHYGENIDVYGVETEHLYNQLFNTEVKSNGLNQHIILTFNKTSKRPTNLRLHTLSWLSEKDWDCKNLKSANPSMN